MAPLYAYPTNNFIENVSYLENDISIILLMDCYVEFFISIEERAGRKTIPRRASTAAV